MVLSTANVRPDGPDVERPFVSTYPSFHHAPFVAGALLEFGGRLAQGESRLAPSGDADRLVRANAFAFLVAVLLDQGVPAERAFTGPLIIEHRLGGLSPAAVLARPNELLLAMTKSPMPHRFPHQATTWILMAARKVVDELGGATERLWSDRPSARTLQMRLQRFAGIGQKKSAMAVEILASDLRVGIKELSGTDVAVDIHVRRVFHRTGLAVRDSVAEIVTAARQAHPEHPGDLDVPAWVVGRTWCRPRAPKCGACPISWACPSALPSS